MPFWLLKNMELLKDLSKQSRGFVDAHLFLTKKG
jgi:hypothetical protein